MTPPRLLVVGGGGFIGRHIVHRAVELGWEVTSLGLSPRQREQESRPAARYVAADITQGEALRKALEGASFECVANCGGYVDHSLLFRGGRKILQAHFRGVLNLIEALDRDGLRAFVNLGSCDEYGNNPAPQVETQREAPISPYSLGKVAATHLLQMLHRTESFPAVTLRLFLTYGPGQDNRRFVPQVIEGCLAGRSFPTSSGEQLRDFCFVQDSVDAVFAAFARPAALGEVINIASGRPVSIRQMIETIQRRIGKGEARFGEIAYRPGENLKLYADISKARALLGWEPKVALETGLDKTIQWIRNRS